MIIFNQNYFYNYLFFWDHLDKENPQNQASQQDPQTETAIKEQQKKKTCSKM